MVDPTEIFVGATHVKARANNKKMQRRIANQEALFYADMLRKDIDTDREKHGKKTLKDKDDHNKPGAGGNDKFEDYTDDIPLDGKLLSAVQQILKADGSERANISMCLPMGLKQPVIKRMDYRFHSKSRKRA